MSNQMVDFLLEMLSSKEEVKPEDLTERLKQVTLGHLDIASFVALLNPNPLMMSILLDLHDVPLLDVMTNPLVHRVLISLAKQFGIDISNLSYDTKILSISGVPELLKKLPEQYRVGLVVLLRKMDIGQLFSLLQVK